MSECSQRQRVGAYAVCVENDRILLCRLSDRTGKPGSWTLPGGGIEFGEHPADGVVREFEEETGLSCQVSRLVAVDSFVANRVHEGEAVEHHGLRIVYEVEVIGGSLRDERDESTDQAGWFTEDEARALPLLDLAALTVDRVFGADRSRSHRLR